MAYPLLSILIPAYGYTHGLKRIFQTLGEYSIDEWEVLVFDDSPHNEVQDYVSTFIASSKCRIEYQHNHPPLGPAANWNALLDSARGKYSLLLHHDEVPVASDFIKSLIGLLRQSSFADVVILDCFIFDILTNNSWRQTASWLRNLIVKRYPRYLYRRNVIGPVSTLVIRSELYPRFDVNLKWLVDVELYVRLLTMRRIEIVFSSLIICSIIGRKDSITSKLGCGIKDLDMVEREYLINIGFCSFWLDRGKSLFGKIIAGFESLVWICYRGLSRSFEIYFRKRVSPRYDYDQ